MRLCILTVSLVCLVGCGLRTTTVKQEVTSPDGKYVASAFITDSGATTPYNAHVHVRKVGTKRGRSGNVYHGRLSPDIELSWLSSTHLTITSGCLEVRRHVTNFHGITIDRISR
jgi:hypothetical protein